MTDQSCRKDVSESPEEASPDGWQNRRFSPEGFHRRNAKIGFASERAFFA
jgi:hypothetical protein